MDRKKEKIVSLYNEHMKNHFLITLKFYILISEVVNVCVCVCIRRNAKEIFGISLLQKFCYKIILFTETFRIFILHRGESGFNSDNSKTFTPKSWTVNACMQSISLLQLTLRRLLMNKQLSISLFWVIYKLIFYITDIPHPPFVALITNPNEWGVDRKIIFRCKDKLKFHLIYKNDLIK